MKKIMILIMTFLMATVFIGCDKRNDSTVSSDLDMQQELYSLNDSEEIEESSLENEVTTAITTAPPVTTTTTPPTTTITTTTTTKATTPAVTTAPPTTTTPAPATTTKATTTAPLTPSQYVSEVVRLVNVERAKEGLSPLTESAELNSAALVRANEAIEVWAHTRPDGRAWHTILKDRGISYKAAGENLANGQTTPSQVVEDWMNSPLHRANIMNSAYAKIGVGYVAGGSNYHYWAQLFTN